ncbi:TYR3-like protein, partial [Mya arenaria]
MEMLRDIWNMRFITLKKYVSGEQIFWECMQRVMWQMAEQMGHNVTRETRDYLDRLLQIAVDPSKEQFPRIRKEYRMMTDDERDRFHKAIQALKEDTTLEPNVYSAIAELHAGDVIPMAHFGAAFPGWHRILLLIFETALRLKDPSVSIPYWASNLDNEMEDPTKSIVWSEQFLGNGDGFVTTGPFANFKVYSTDTILTRNIGASGSLMTNDGIHGILSRNRTAHITYPSAPKQYNLELQHNALHVWMGGNMDDLSQSAEDPVFYLHHSFVDYLWEEFRTRQKMIGIDPETDYPESNWGDDNHAPDAAIGFGDLRNVDALSNVIADLVKYDPSPVCTRSHPTCISKYLRCDSSRSYPACVSLSQEELNPLKDNHVEVCVEAHLTRAVQNTFSINQYCDIRKWAYIPVKIVLQRPPEFTNYKAFPVLNNKPVMTTDVFSTISVNRNITEHLASYPNCKVTSAVARKIYVESYGLNYYGKYKDFTVLDQRHALSSATTYLGVKSPESNYTDVIVYAFDYCGRTCRPFCLDVSSNPPKSTPCSGVLRITSEDPKLYGDDYAEAVNMLWNADSPDELPENAPLHFITFYCDYSGTWPWDEEMQRKVHGPKRQFKHEPVLRESNVQDVVHQKLVQPVVANKRPPLRTANTPSPVEKAKTASQTVPEKKKKT